MAEPLRLQRIDDGFGLHAASRLLVEVVAPWVQELGLLVERIEATPPAGANLDWQPGAVIRLPFTRKLCRDSGSVCSQALMSVADTAMMLACAAAWDGYRPMNAVDQTMHFLRAANFDVLAEARIIRVSRASTFGRVTLFGAADKRPVGMVSAAYTPL